MGVQVIDGSGRTTTQSPLTASEYQIQGFQRIYSRCFPEKEPVTRSYAKEQLELYLWEIHLFGGLLDENMPIEFEDWLKETLK